MYENFLAIVTPNKTKIEVYFAKKIFHLKGWLWSHILFLTPHTFTILLGKTSIAQQKVSINCPEHL